MMLSRGHRGFAGALFLGVGTLLGWSPASAQTFSDQTTQLGLKMFDTTAAWGDYDNDGWVDLLVGHKVWRNVDGTGFKLAFTLSPIMDVQRFDYDYDIWGDYDNDGYLDIATWAGTALLIFHNDAGDGFTLTTVPVLSPLSRSRGLAWGDFNGDGFVDLYVGGDENAQRHGEIDVILTNNQGTSFSATWVEPDPPGPEKIKVTRGIAVCDFDQDGDMDIHVSSYRDDEDYLWRNDGTGVFTDAAGELGLNDLPDGVGIQGATIGSAWGDLDNDGYFDLFEGNLSHSTYRKQPSFHKNLGPSGNWHFEDKTAIAGLAWQESYDTPALGDYDNDGDLDLYYTTAYYSADRPDHSVLYRNDGDWHFTDITSSAGLAGLILTEQAAWADFDRDGDLDLVTDGRLFVNGGNANHWIGVKLFGANGVGNVVGSQVRITGSTGVPGTVSRQVEAGTGQANQNDMTLHLGLGNSTGTVTVEVTWPDATTCQVPGAAVDSRFPITYPCCPDFDWDGVCN